MVMSTQLFPLTLNTPSESSIGNTSSQWSASTPSTTPKGDTQSLVKEERENPTNECFPLWKLIQLFFRLRKHSKVVDNAKILQEIKENTHLITDFLDGCTHKLDFFAEQACFPRATFTGTNGTMQGRSSLCLPTAQIWTAAYLLKLCLQSPQVDSMSENFGEENLNQTKRTFINSTTFRQLLLLLYWEMEVTKRVAREFYGRFVKFSGIINNAFKKLRTIILTSSKSKTTWISLFSNIDIKDTDFYEKLNLDVKSKRNKGTFVLEVTPKLHSEFPFSLSIDTINNDDVVLTKNQDFSRVEKNKKEEIIAGLLKSVVDSVESCHFLLEGSSKRICSKGIIKLGPNRSKDVTCYSCFNSIKYLAAELLSSKNYFQPNEAEIKELHDSLSTLLERWAKYEESAKWVLLKFFELCDMITICYLFSLQHTKMNLPEIGVIQNEVSIKSKIQNGKVRSKENKLKHYAIWTIIEECDAKTSNANTTNVLGTQIESECNFYHNLMTSTKYHLAIQEYPLELENGCSKSLIVLRPIPDLERVYSDMILFDQQYEIKIARNNNSSNYKRLENVMELKTFKK